MTLERRCRLPAIDVPQLGSGQRQQRQLVVERHDFVEAAVGQRAGGQFGPQAPTVANRHIGVGRHGPHPVGYEIAQRRFFRGGSRQRVFHRSRGEVSLSGRARAPLRAPGSVCNLDWLAAPACLRTSSRHAGLVAGDVQAVGEGSSLAQISCGG